MRRYAPLILSVLFLLTSLSLYQSTLDYFQPRTCTRPAACSSAAVYQLYAASDGELHFVGTLRADPRGARFYAPGGCPFEGEARLVRDGDTLRVDIDMGRMGLGQWRFATLDDRKFRGCASLQGRPLPCEFYLVRIAG